MKKKGKQKKKENKLIDLVFHSRFSICFKFEMQNCVNGWKRVVVRRVMDDFITQKFIEEKEEKNHLSYKIFYKK